MTDADERRKRFGWRLTVQNHTDQVITFNAQIKFMDRDGFVVATEYENRLSLQPNEKRTFTGDNDVYGPAANNIAQVGADLTPL